MVFLVLISAQAQDTQNLYDLYNQKKFAELNQKVSILTKKYPNNIEIRFFKTIMIEDGDKAFKIYEELYKSAQGTLKTYIAQKIADYFYAMGYYVKASEYQRVATSVRRKEPQQQTVNPAASSELIIQVGAFKFIENAQYLQKILQSHNITSRVVKREIESKTLYCVWLDGKSNFEETRDYAENIKKKLNLQYRIFKP
jgi:hypothetical protein